MLDADSRYVFCDLRLRYEDTVQNSFIKENIREHGVRNSLWNQSSPSCCVSLHVYSFNTVSFLWHDMLLISKDKQDTISERSDSPESIHQSPSKEKKIDLSSLGDVHLSCLLKMI